MKKLFAQRTCHENCVLVHPDISFQRKSWDRIFRDLKLVAIV